jgi:hypothetical protein
MAVETLEPGEWGPFEELAAASAEILRLRSLLRWKGVDADDPALVPPGHLVYQPQRAEDARGRAHRTVRVRHAGMSAEIDEPIAELVLELWRAGLRTVNSCQDNPRGYVWLELASAEDAGRLVDLITGGGGAETYGLENRALREGPAGFWPLSRGLWLYKALPVRDGGTIFLISVRFPHADLPAVLEKLRAHNAV